MYQTKHLLIIFLLSLISQTVSGQLFNDVSFLTEEKLDSIVIFKILYKNKEFIAPIATKMKPSVKDSITGEFTLPYYDETEDERDRIVILSRKKLTEVENTNLNKFLKKQSSYNNKDVALSNHYDIEVNYYKQGIIIQNVKVSTITKKITIIKEDCEIFLGKENINSCVFYSNICKKFEKYIFRLSSK